MKTYNSEKECVAVTVRITDHIIEQIDAFLGQEDVLVSCNHWITETPIEKLKLNVVGDGSNGAR